MPCWAAHPWRHNLIKLASGNRGAVQSRGGSNRLINLMSQKLNVIANRRSRKWSKRELIGRALWDLLYRPLFALTPRLFWGWRRQILRLFGAHIGRGVHIFPSTKITIPWNLSVGDFSAIGDGVILYALGPIRIGERVTVSQYAHLCAGTHDYSDPSMTLLKPQIIVGDEAWICADAFIGPGVVIGDRAIVAARSVAVNDVPNDTIAGGNPAKIIKPRPRFS